MKITVIGYSGGFPDKNEACSGYLIQGEGYNILIDCGSGVLSLLQNYIDINKIDAVILSHYHADHMSDIYCFQYQTGAAFALGFRNKPLEIYSHKLSSKFQEMNYKKFCIAKAINENSVLKFGDLNISFKWMKHAEDSLGMRLEEKGKIFAYSGDTEWCDNVIDLCKDADIFLSECSLLNEQIGKVKGHLSAGQCGKIASISKVKKLILTHLSQFNDMDKIQKEVSQEYKGTIINASKGLVLKL